MSVSNPIKHVLRVFLNGFKNEPFYEFIGEVTLKIDLVWNRKNQPEKFIKNSERACTKEE